MKRNALLTFVCCLLMGVAAMVAAPVTAMAIPYHAADSELQGTAYAVFSPTTGELDFVRSTETHANGDTGTVTSISGGTYTGTIYASPKRGRGITTHPWSVDSSNVKSVKFVDAVRPTSTYSWFDGMTNCTSMDLSKLDTSQVTNMNSMFSGCKYLRQLVLDSFDTSRVTDMRWMFNGCSKLASLDVSGFDTASVTDMSM
ncbi:BspA family leucine-rich repeat surface protein, partial [Olsenella sp. AM30-3LB]|uniref:BspA family leucine-rich repeat surface protein n=1 Tax=Olsenella sp. AM30-3LB TaxID=2292359 RepID=UPI0018F418DA